MLLIALGLALALPGRALAGGPQLLVGAAEDAPKQPTLAAAKAQMTMLHLAGLDAVRMTVQWTTGETEPSQGEQDAIANAVEAADLDSIRVFLAVFPRGSSVTPLTDGDRSDFAKFAASVAGDFPTVEDFIVGNEPNTNRYWLPQFDSDGADSAATGFLRLLAPTYDALKQVSPDIRVWGLGLSPRGGDNPSAARKTHSPTAFISDLGQAYRDSGRALPIMDGLAIHPYAESSNIAPPNSSHPTTTSIGLADYGKLVGLLGQAFDGTGQPGSSLPIIYAEYGVESQIPAGKADLYTGAEIPVTKPVSEKTQALYYKQAMALAFCQPTVQGLFIFHTVDEKDMARWQSGLYYVDGKAKASRDLVRGAAELVHRGVITSCAGLELRPKLTGFSFLGAKPPYRRVPPRLRLRCDLDCKFVVRVQRLPQETSTLGARGSAVGGSWQEVSLPRRGLAPGRYRVLLVLWAPLNTGPVRPVVATRFTIVSS
ncbi:MAG: hypothetical protein ACXVZ1_08170 [Gaiellaceae bacterium]